MGAGNLNYTFLNLNVAEVGHIPIEWATAEGWNPGYPDIPGVNPQAVALAESFGIKKVFETARMYTGPFPDIDMCKIFSGTNYGLG